VLIITYPRHAHIIIVTECYHYHHVLSLPCCCEIPLPTLKSGYILMVKKISMGSSPTLLLPLARFLTILLERFVCDGMEML
jgi:hypothetical protein